MTTARTLIKSALRKISVLGAGQSLAAEEAADALSALNAMLASWSVEGTMVFTETKENFSLVAGTDSYTIGTSQTFNTSKPIDIVAAYVRFSDTDYTLDIIDQRQYASIADKDLSGTPAQIYYDNNYPTGRLYLWPVPSSTMTLTLMSEKYLTGFSTLDTEYGMPPEYERAIVYNLAMEIAPEYEREASMSVMKIAGEAKANIKNMNSKNDNNAMVADIELIGAHSYNIYTGR